MDWTRYEVSYEFGYGYFVDPIGSDAPAPCNTQYVLAEDFDRVTAERDALQIRLNAVEDENDRLREALTKITCIEYMEFGDDWEELDEAIDIAREALGVTNG